MNLRRFPLLAAAVLVLLSGLWAGLLRMGWGLPGDAARLGAVHGPLMVCGFLGVLIALERALALGQAWGYVAPALTGLGALAALVGPPGSAALLMLLASIVLTLAGAVVFRRERSGSPLTLAVAAALWLVGNAVWAGGGTIPEAVGWWSAFIVLTIAGGRFRESPPRRWPRYGFAIAASALGAGVALGPLAGDIGGRIAGVALIGLSAWLLAYDTPRRTLGQRGLPRYSAVCSLLAYGWLAAAGALAVSGGALTPGAGYDMRLHALFVGFVFSMVFGQAPFVFPEMLQGRLRFGARLYVPVVVLHVSLVLRVAGDITRTVWARQWGGLIGAVSILLFVATMLSLSSTARDDGAGVA
jgi:hypothetical protein